MTAFRFANLDAKKDCKQNIASSLLNKVTKAEKQTPQKNLQKGYLTKVFIFQ